MDSDARRRRYRFHIAFTMKWIPQIGICHHAMQSGSKITSKKSEGSRNPSILLKTTRIKIADDIILLFFFSSSTSLDKNLGSGRIPTEWINLTLTVYLVDVVRKRSCCHDQLVEDGQFHPKCSSKITADGWSIDLNGETTSHHLMEWNEITV